MFKGLRYRVLYLKIFFLNLHNDADGLSVNLDHVPKLELS